MSYTSWDKLSFCARDKHSAGLHESDGKVKLATNRMFQFSTTRVFSFSVAKKIFVDFRLLDLVVALKKFEFITSHAEIFCEDFNDKESSFGTYARLRLLPR